MEVRRILLILCPNGEWRSAVVEFYIAPGSVWESASKQEILEHLTKLDVLLIYCSVFVFAENKQIQIPNMLFADVDRNV